MDIERMEREAEIDSDEWRIDYAKLADLFCEVARDGDRESYAEQRKFAFELRRRARE